METAKARSPFFATKVCFFVGLAALALWMLTFRPHDNSNLDWLLFPVAARISDLLFPQSDVPVWFWYGACLLQYPMLGLVIDALRHLRRLDERPARARTPSFDLARRTELLEKLHRVSPPGSNRPYPLVTLDDFFVGNDCPGSICANIADAPPPREICTRLKRLLEKPEIHSVWVEIRDLDEGDWPFSDVVYLVTRAPMAQVAPWVAEAAKGFEPDEIGEGWYQDAPPDAPEPPPGFRYVHLWWD